MPHGPARTRPHSNVQRHPYMGRHPSRLMFRLLRVPMPLSERRRRLRMQPQSLATTARSRLRSLPKARTFGSPVQQPTRRGAMLDLLMARQPRRVLHSRILGATHRRIPTPRPRLHLAPMRTLQVRTLRQGHRGHKQPRELEVLPPMVRITSRAAYPKLGGPAAHNAYSSRVKRLQRPTESSIRGRHSSRTPTMVAVRTRQRIHRRPRRRVRTRAQCRQVRKGYVQRSCPRSSGSHSPNLGHDATGSGRAPFARPMLTVHRRAYQVRRAER